MDEYKYLDELTDETRKMIIDDLKAGKKNLYHSVMACLQNRIKNGNFSRSEEREAEYYISRQKVPEDRKENIREIVFLCYKRLFERGVLT